MAKLKDSSGNRILRPRRVVLAVFAFVSFIGVSFWGCNVIETGPFAMKTANSVGGSSHRGFSIFQQHCASCHGEDGQGVDEEYDEPLLGKRSINSLARYIDRDMPEDEPENVVGKDALRVADYIYKEFYSVEARYRKGLMPRVELARFTVPQYRNAVADLLLHFTPEVSQELGKEVPKEKEEEENYEIEDKPVELRPILPGLSAQYYQSKGMNKANEVQVERVDRRIEFDFGTRSPAESITPDQFSIVWQGSLLARQTGFYEFRVSTQNGARLYINSENTGQRKRMRDDSSVAGQAAVIDGWVSSGEMREITARIFLLGGRQFPLRFEFFKYLEETASVKLEWKQPGGAWSVLNHNHVNTSFSPRTFVVDTPFPADDRSFGYERGSSVSPGWHAATTNAAIATSAEIVDRLPLLAELDAEEDNEKEEESAQDGTDKEGFAQEENLKRVESFKSFVLNFASLAFRRPLTEEEKQLLGEEMFANAVNPQGAVRRALILILKSPSFLYADLTPENLAPDQYAIANRLSLAIWDSVPDTILLEAAGKGELLTPVQIETQARRMILDTRARSKMRRFFNHWLELEDRDIAKDKTLFPEFDESVVADLRHSLDLFLEDVIWSEGSDYRQLLLADYLFLDEDLKKLYGTSEIDAKNPASAGNRQSGDNFKPVVYSPDRRSGVLTHPYLLSAFAYHNNTSPIHRGVFMTRNIIGRELKSPPEAVEFKDEEFSPDATMRDKITQLTRDQACMSCHKVINPLGFALENFDAVGRWRTEDNNKAVVTRSRYVTEDGEILEVASARDIAEFAIESESARRTFVIQLFEHLVKQPPHAYGLDTIDELEIGFSQDDFNIQNLMVNIAVLSAGYGPATLQIAQSEK
jgi:hypothetical protein